MAFAEHTLLCLAGLAAQRRSGAIFFFFFGGNYKEAPHKHQPGTVRTRENGAWRRGDVRPLFSNSAAGPLEPRVA